MKATLRFIVAGAVFFAGCKATYHVVTAPVRVFHHPDRKPATSDDVTTPGRPVASTPAPAVRPQVVERKTDQSQSPTPRPRPAQVTPRPEMSPKNVLAQFPVAKPVPNRPGWVYSPSDPAKYVDVTGYASGSKVKDPYSGKIFTVP